jgi:predicted lipoprotein with Yx(FWY)xxD motif
VFRDPRVHEDDVKTRPRSVQSDFIGGVHAARMKNISLALAFVAALLAGCGGGGSTGAVPGSTPGGTTTPPTTTSSAVLSTMTLNGGPAFVTAAQLPVYTFGGDTVPNQSTCTVASGCLAVWPSVAPPSGTLPAPWSSFTRSDNGAIQLAYNGAALYTFTGDKPGIATGDGVQNFHLARPLANGSTGGPGTPGYP